MEAIRSAVERVVRHYEENPGAALESDAAAVAVRDGPLRFRVSGPHGDIFTDTAEAAGGGGSAPTPGWYLRAAVAACGASVIAIEAARDGISLSRLEVAVTSKTDFRGTLGMDDSVPAGPLAMQVQVRVASEDADDDALRAVVERSEKLSVVGNAVSRAVPLDTEIVLGE